MRGIGFVLGFVVLFLGGCQAGQAQVRPDNLEAGPTNTEGVPTDSEAVAVNPANTEPAPTATAVPDTPVPIQTPTSAPADSESKADADVLFVRAQETAAETWTFAVTVWHPDTGWEDYADGWDVVLPDETVVKPDPDSPFTRLLLHPHENEQPFTRGQSNIHIQADVTAVTVRAHDLVDGFGGQELVIDLTQSEKTSSYEVIKLAD